jgi:cytochrome c
MRGSDRRSIAGGCLVAAMLAIVPLAAAQSPERASPVPASPAPFSGEAARGEQLYQSRCSACHSMDANRIGPSHRGVVGRRVASVPGFRYSTALRKRTFVWDEATLDRWLENPTAFVPGTAMGIRVPAPRDRADIIAYLRTQRLAASP